MNDFLIYAARLQDAGVCSLWVSLGSDKNRTRLMHVSPDAHTPPELAAKYPTRTFTLSGTDQVLATLKEEVVYSEDGPTQEKIQAAIAAHPLLADDLREWFADYLLIRMPTDAELDAADDVSDSEVEHHAQFLKGLMRGIDAGRKIRARKAV